MYEATAMYDDVSDEGDASKDEVEAGAGADFGT
jgi:hypothetical protein